MTNTTATIIVDIPPNCIDEAMFSRLVREIRKLVAYETGLTHVTRGEYVEPCYPPQTRSGY